MDKERAIKTMTALSQRTRLDAFRLLIKAGAKGMAAGEVGEKLGVVQNTMSAHLATLKNAGLIRRERQSRIIRYYANYHALHGLLDFLMEDCCSGNLELSNPVSEGNNPPVSITKTKRKQNV